MLIVTNRYAIDFHWLQISFNQLWYLRVSNSPEAGATSLLCHLLVRHPYGNVSSVAGAILFPTAFFVISNTGPTAVAAVPMQRMLDFFFLHEETNLRSHLAKPSWTALYIKSAVRRSL